MSELCVLRPEDLKGKTVQGRATEIVENRRMVFVANLEYLLKSNRLSQAALCNSLDGVVSPSTLSGYKKENSNVSSNNVAVIANYFGLTPEQMTGELLDPAAGGAKAARETVSHAQEYDKYVGAYDLSFFNTDKPMGENRRITPESLARAFVVVYATLSAAGVRNYRVAALMNCTVTERSEARRLVGACDLQKADGTLVEMLESVVQKSRLDPAGRVGPRLKALYRGEIRLTDEVACLDLEQVYGSDIAHMMINNRAAKTSEGKTYKGGLGVILSVSRGSEHAPCVQSVLFSRAPLDESGRTQNGDEGKTGDSRKSTITEEGLAQQLYFDCPTIEFDDEADDLAAFFKMMYLSEEGSLYAALKTADKKYLVEQLIKKRLNEIVRKNFLSYYKVSETADTAAYRYVDQNRERG